MLRCRGLQWPFTRDDYQLKLVKFKAELVWHQHADTDEVDECQLMLIEPRGVVNTGEAGGALTAKNDVWV